MTNMQVWTDASGPFTIHTVTPLRFTGHGFVTAARKLGTPAFHVAPATVELAEPCASFARLASQRRALHNRVKRLHA